MTKYYIYIIGNALALVDASIAIPTSHLSFIEFTKTMKTFPK